ncbi:hypothetical protein C8Q78DRAFT_1022409 [Trametes maxima]|nr:hypothetical protein C8Q78DRAFT_1022409 [Trametes maxima]
MPYERLTSSSIGFLPCVRAHAARMQEQEQLQAIRDSLAANSNEEPAKLKASEGSAAHGQPADAADFEGGYGGQEELEDRYATTYGMH